MERPGFNVLDPARVRAERAKVGIKTDSELAQRMGVRPATVSEALSGSHSVGLDFLCRLYVVLSIARTLR